MTSINAVRNAENKREKNYEILRIVAMLMIVCLHYLSKGGALAEPKGNLTATGYAAWFIEAFCLVAVNVYVLISGYFGIGEKDEEQNKINSVMKRTIRIWFQVWFYSVVIGVIFLITGLQEFTIYTVFTYLFPIATEHYWFATAYLLLTLLMPFLNVGFDKMDKRSIQGILGCMLLIFSVAKTVLPMQLPWDHQGYDAFWFVFLYLTGAYLRRYGVKWITSRAKAVFMYVCCSLLIFASFVVIRFLHLRYGVLGDFINYGYSYNFLFCYLASIGFFLAFQTSKKAEENSCSRALRTFSGATFGVYLIHEHVNLRYLWPTWFACADVTKSAMPVFLLHMIGTVGIVYLLCTVLEIVRNILMHKVFSVNKIADVIAMFILLCYPLRKVTLGLDMMDAGYALGNYRFFDTMDEMWKLATYLANVIGVLFTSLPFGDTWVGMNVYTSLLIGITAACSYRFLVNIGIGHRLIIFLGELIALSLCWAPSVILYHYLGYILMTVAVLLLYLALTKEKKGYFVCAGLLLGCAVAVRMPNITYMALILPVWYYAWLNRKEGTQTAPWFRTLLGQTCYCVLGYCTGLAVPIGYICFKYGMTAYPRMITSLFGMTDTATDYKPTSMVTAMFEDYIAYSIWLLLFVGYLLCGIALAYIAQGRFEKVKKIVYIAGMLVLLRFCYGRGMFDFNYTAYFSMYKWVTVFLQVSILLSIGLLLSKHATKEQKLWAVFLLVIIFVTPLGSNNGLYPIINNLFLVAPITMAMLWQVAGKLSEQIQKVRESGTMLRFVMKSMTIFFLACVSIQSILFGIRFVFHDNAEHMSDYKQVNIVGSFSTKGLRTTVDKAEELNKLGAYLTENELLQKKVILYGDIPAISYIFDLQPAIYTTWADLASKSLELLEEELASEQVQQKIPLIIVSADIAEKMEHATERQKDEKMEAIYQYMTVMGYELTYSSTQFYVFEVADM